MIPKPPAREAIRTSFQGLDTTGFVLFAGSAVQLLLALQWGGVGYAWGSATVIGLFGGSGVTFIMWYYWNYRRGANALIPISIMRQKVVWCGSVCALLLLSAQINDAYYLPIYFQAARGASPLESGVYYLASILSQVICTIVAGVLSEFQVPPWPPFSVPAALIADNFTLFKLEKLASVPPLCSLAVLWRRWETASTHG